MKCVAFLRAVNVGGHNAISKQQFIDSFKKIGLKNPQTYIQSGNIVFETEMSREKAAESIKRELEKITGNDIWLILLNKKQIEDIIKLNPFKSAKEPPNHQYVTFMSEPQKNQSLKSKNGDCEVIMIRNDAAFSVSRPVNGRYGNPVALIERTFKVRSTTRNWNTINAIKEMMA